jgi:hypothetical protein
VVLGAVSAAIGLGGMTYALTQGADDTGPAMMATVVGITAMLVFWWVERRSRTPMLPLDMFGSRTFSAANLASFFLYGALAAFLFVLPIRRASRRCPRRDRYPAGDAGHHRNGAKRGTRHPGPASPVP